MLSIVASVTSIPCSLRCLPRDSFIHYDPLLDFNNFILPLVKHVFPPLLVSSGIDLKTKLEWFKMLPWIWGFSTVYQAIYWKLMPKWWGQDFFPFSEKNVFYQFFHNWKWARKVLTVTCTYKNWWLIYDTMQKFWNCNTQLETVNCVHIFIKKYFSITNFLHHYDSILGMEDLILFCWTAFLNCRALQRAY